MESKYKAIFIQHLVTPPPLESTPILIYGAGKAGLAVADALVQRGYVVAGFLDKNAKPEQQIGDIPVYTLGAWLTSNNPEKYAVIMAVLNREFLFELSTLEHQIRQSGFKQVFNFHQFYYAFPKALPEEHAYFWLMPLQEFTEAYAALDQLDALLCDETSRINLENIVRFRLTGDVSLIPDATPKEIYMPRDLPSWPKILRFIDCGAFTGDTIASFTENGYIFEAIAAFEPDPDTFHQLVNNTKSYSNIVRIPCALGDKTEIIRFIINTSGSMTDSGHVAYDRTEKWDAGKNLIEQPVQSIKLDEVLPSFAPNLIKMDIESFEPNALIGAHDMITRHRPGLAISIYHMPEQLWTIPLMIQSWNLNYRFYIRNHCAMADIVLYAYPAEWLS